MTVDALTLSPYRVPSRQTARRSWNAAAARHHRTHTLDGSLVPSLSSFVLDAATFAAARHADQRRKHCDGAPYINHLLEVAREISVTAGNDDPATLAAALLHDALEATDSTAGEIAERFGAKVAELVLECSDDASLSRKERKQAQIDHAPNLTPSAKLIKLADKLCNVRDVRIAPSKKWSTKRRKAYVEWAGKVVTALGPVNDVLEKSFWDESEAAAQELA